MPDLGQYAGPVLASYAVAILLLVVLTALSLMRASKAKKTLDELEARRRNNG